MSDFAKSGEIELTIEQAMAKIRKKDQALKLASNREFKALILNGYFEEEAVRLTNLTGEFNAKEHRDEIFDMLKGISHMRQFMQRLVREGELAEQELHDHRMLMDELNDEDDGAAA